MLLSVIVLGNRYRSGVTGIVHGVRMRGRKVGMKMVRCHLQRWLLRWWGLIFIRRWRYFSFVMVSVQDLF